MNLHTNLSTYRAFECGNITEVPEKLLKTRNKIIQNLHQQYKPLHNNKISFPKVIRCTDFIDYSNPFVNEIYNNFEDMDKLTDHFYCYYYAIYDNINLYIEVNDMIDTIYVFAPRELYSKMYSFLFKTSIITDTYIKDAPLYIFDLQCIAFRDDIDCTYMDEFEKVFNIKYPINTQTHQLIHNVILHTYMHLYNNSVKVRSRLTWLMQNNRINIPRLFIFSYIYSNIFMLWARCTSYSHSCMLHDTALQSILQK
jgi:hypothetical protein